MDSKPKTVSEVQAQIDRIAAHRARFVERRNLVAASIEAAQQHAQEKFFESADPAAVKELTTARLHAESELTLLEHALGRLDGEQFELQRELKAAVIADLRARATALRNEVARIDERAEPILQKLGALYDITISAEVVCAARNPAANWVAHHEAFGIPLSHRNPSEVVAVSYDRLNLFFKPRTRKLLEEALELEAKAAQMEAGMAEVELASGVVIVNEADLPRLSPAEMEAQISLSQAPAKLIGPGSLADPLATAADRIELTKKRANSRSPEAA